MARFAFICVPTSGHVAPLAAVAKELTRRGHTTTFIHHPEIASLLEPFGVTFKPIVALDPAWLGRLDAAIERAGQVRGVLGVRALMDDFAKGCEILCERLPDALRALAVDCVVSDWIEPAAGLVARHLGLPYVSIAAALPLNWSPGDASPFVGWAHRPGRPHRWASMGAQWIAERIQSPTRQVIRRYADRWQLGPGARVENWASSYAQIAQITPSLDYDRKRLIGCFHYCGPLRPSPMVRPASRMARARRRRAFASLGSLQGHRTRIFEWIADAAEALDLDLTIAHGGRLSDADAARLTRRATVHAFVDYASVLGESDVAIMHGGLNGVLDCLAFGVPLVIVPIAYEQGAIAARVSRTGAGRVCRPLARGDELVAALADILNNPAYAQAAGRVGAEITASGGTRLAADIIEQVARTRAPCLNAATILADPQLANWALGESRM